MIPINKSEMRGWSLHFDFQLGYIDESWQQRHTISDLSFMKKLKSGCCQVLPRDEEVDNRKFRRFHYIGDSPLTYLFAETFTGFVLPAEITRKRLSQLYICTGNIARSRTIKIESSHITWIIVVVIVVIVILVNCHLVCIVLYCIVLYCLMSHKIRLVDCWDYVPASSSLEVREGSNCLFSLMWQTNQGTAPYSPKWQPADQILKHVFVYQNLTPAFNFHTSPILRKQL